MARQDINTGTVANDGTGDTLRGAAGKINQTFVEIYQMLGGGDSNNLSAQITIEDSAVVFEGATSDDFETRLIAKNVGTDVLISLPDSSGTLALVDGLQTLTNKTINSSTLNSPKILTAINDTNGREQVKFTSVSNAVNEVSISNNSSSNPPKVSATGDDTNLNLEVRAKGSGVVELSKLSLDTTTVTNSGETVSNDFSSIVVTPGASAWTMTVPDGVSTGEIKTIMNTSSTYTATITPSSFQHTGDTSFTIPTDTSAMIVWNGSAWSIIGNLSSVTLS